MPPQPAPLESRELLFISHIAREAMETACEVCGLPVDVLASKRRAAPIVVARQIAMYLSHVVGQLTLSEVSMAFDRDRSTVSHACHIIEDRRDSPFFDRQIQFMENQMRARLNAFLARYEIGAVLTEIDARVRRAGLGR